jgi:antitoxin HicB
MEKAIQKSIEKSIEYYLGLPYTLRLIPEPGGGWFVEVAELRGCMSEGNDPGDAIAMIRDAMRCWLEVALEDGLPIPEPRELETYSGKFVVRVPRWLHRELVRTTDQEGVSLNQFVSTALARAVGEYAGIAQRTATPAWAATETGAKLDAARTALGAVAAALKRGDAASALRLAEESGSLFQKDSAGGLPAEDRQAPSKSRAAKARKGEPRPPSPPPAASYVVSPQAGLVCLADGEAGSLAADAGQGE